MLNGLVFMKGEQEQMLKERGQFHKKSQTLPELRLSQELKSEPSVFAKSWT